MIVIKIIFRYIVVRRYLIMCTSITLNSLNNDYILARNMDFSFELNPFMAFFPRNAALTYHQDCKPDTNHYAFMGLSKKLDTYVLADGINEHGLAGAALYYKGYAHYDITLANLGTETIYPEHVISFMLAKCRTLDDVEKSFKSIRIEPRSIPRMNIVPPLHWIFRDSLGNDMIVELNQHEISIIKDTLGVMANSPDYNWHLTHTRLFTGLTTHQSTDSTFNNTLVKPFGGDGAMGLPGDYTSPSRFIRALFNLQNSKEEQTANETIIRAMHILGTVNIPKGIIETTTKAIDYTQYSTYMVTNNLTYVYRLYSDLIPRHYNLNDYEWDTNEIKILE